MRLLSLALLAFGCSNNEEAEELPPLDPTFPGAEWETAEPVQVGVNAEAVTALIDRIYENGVVQGVVVVRDGYVIGERYSTDSSSDSACTSWSMAKSFYASAMGAAIEEGLVGSFDDPVATYISEWEGTDKADLTIRNLLEMRSGLDNDNGYLFAPDLNEYSVGLEVVNPIDSEFDYNNYNTQIVGEILQRVSGTTATDYLVSTILDPIGFQEVGYWSDASGNSLTFAGIDATTREFARFGYLAASEGDWDGEQVLAAETLTDLTEAGSDDFYGMHWWSHGVALVAVLEMLAGAEISGSSPSISLPLAIGANGQFIVPWPEEDIVLAINTDYSPPATDDRVYALTNFPATKPQGDQLFAEIDDIVEFLADLPE